MALVVVLGVGVHMETVDANSATIILARDDLRHAKELLEALVEDSPDATFEEAIAHIVDALDAVKRVGNDGRWGE
jgi:fructose-1,6-bisphosphatase